MITITVSLWWLAVVCFLCAVLFPFINVNSGRLNLLALGLLFAAMTHVLPAVWHS